MILQFLCEKRDSILQRWLTLISNTYPGEGARFLAGEQNNFANPVGAAMRAMAERVYDECAGDMNRESIACGLEEFIKMRAVQDFAPSSAIGFVFLLKRAVIDEMTECRIQPAAIIDYADFNTRVDEIAMIGFDIYMHARELLHELRSSEMRRRNFRESRKTSVCDGK